MYTKELLDHVSDYLKKILIEINGENSGTIQ